MSINFSSKDLSTQIISSCVSADDHDVKNLISDVLTQRVKGFQGEAFVRAPVTIEVNLPIPITIHKIDITPWIGRQCAKVIKIYAGTVYSNRKKDEHRFSQDGKNPVFKEIGCATLTHKQKLSFVNAGYKPITGGECSELVNGTVIRLRGFLQRISILRITVSCMLVGSIPSIGSLDVWGKPAQSTVRDPLRDRILSKYHEKRKRTSDRKQTSSIANNFQSTSVEDSNQKEKEMECPQEFLDPLTYQMMRAPILLPCGNTIDRSTLDKHMQAQAELGNVPSDPFTGIPFTEDSKPQPNVLLKMRMDSYNYRNLQKNVEVGVPESAYSTRNSMKRLNEHETQYCKKLKTEKSCHIQPGNFAFHEGLTKSSGASSHDMALRNSLNDALQKTLDGRRERRISLRTSETSNLYCAMCNAFLSSSIVQYQLPCQHILCNNCMRNPENICSRCPTCSEAFESKNVTRIHS